MKCDFQLSCQLQFFLETDGKIASFQASSGLATSWRLIIDVRATQSGRQLGQFAPGWGL